MNEKRKELRIDELLAALAENQIDEVQDLARGSLVSLFILFRLALMHNLNNQAFQKPLAAMTRVVNEYVNSYSGFSLKLKGDSFFINNNMIRLDSTSFTASEYLSKLFPKLGMDAVLATANIEAADILEMLKALQKATSAKDDQERKSLLAGHRFGAFYIRGTTGEPDPLLEFKRDVQLVYTVLATQLGEIVRLAERGRFPPLGKLKRLVQRMADLIEANPDITAAIACFYGGPAHHKSHPINVMILSLLLGQAIGLDRRKAADLGLAALLHDIGMVQTPDNGAWGNQVPTVPESTNLLTQIKSPNQHVLTWTVASYEVSLYTGRYDLHDKGYYSGFAPSLLARIIAIAHLYERMVNTNTQRAVSPHSAVLNILKRASKRLLDPQITKAFLHAFGIYPVGTLVELNNGMRGTVIRKRPGAQGFSVPVVKPLVRADLDAEPATPIDLAANAGLRIARAVPPQELRINVPAEVLK